MVECFLVVALSVNGAIISRNFNTYPEIPEERTEFVMALEAGRNGAFTANFLRENSSKLDYTYGYNCGEGWVDQGISESEVF